ncbi:MAG: DUF2807 domain-containing protein, partial [Cyanobacteria bacterium REEB65]|nr:DUF2807 domain-containing protein [Cyanobacteria bacterium REEB65]
RAWIGGHVHSMTASLYGACHLTADHLQADAATVSLSGASHATVWAVKTLSVAASGASRVSYAGKPTVTADLSGISSVHPL